MPADALKCKECSTTYPLDARYVCSAASVHSRSPTRRRQALPTSCAAASRRARTRCGGTRTSCPSRPPRARCRPAGRRWSELIASPRGSGSGEVWVKNETANPTHSFKDRVVSVALARAQELGFETIACASTGNLANAVAAHAAAAGLPSYVFIPADLEAEKMLATGAYGTNIVAIRGNYDAVNRLCTEVAGERRRGRSSTSTCGRTTPRAPRPWRTRPPSSSAGSCPTGWSRPIASGSLFTKVARGFQEFIDAGLLAGEVPVMCGAQAEGCSPVAPRSRRGPTSAARSSPTRSPSRSPSATRPTARTRSSSRGPPAA